MLNVKIVDKLTGTRVPAIIEPINDKDYVLLEQDQSFKFNWCRYSTPEYDHYVIFKIRRVDSPVILGLMSLIDELIFEAVEIKEIEVSGQNRGCTKEHDNIAGCLIAFACQDAIKRRNGNVLLIAKSGYENLYCGKYGFKAMGGFLESDAINSNWLVNKYLPHVG